MPKINPISRKKLMSKLKALGFEGPFIATKHQYMIKGRSWGRPFVYKFPKHRGHLDY